MTRRIVVTRAIATLALMLAEAELISGPLRSGLLQAAIALPLALYLPGAAMQRLLTHQADDGLSDHLVTAVGLSLAVLVVGGVALNLLEVGLRPITWLVYLSVVILGGQLGVLVGSKHSSAGSLILIPRLRLWQLAAGVTIVGLVAAAFAVSIIGAHRQKFPGFSQLWLIPHSGSPSYELGVANDTGRGASYSVRLKAGRTSVRSWTIRLASGESWVAAVSLPAHVFVKATLFRDGTQAPYRQVFIRDTSE